MMGHKICFYVEIWLIISKLSLLPLHIWSTDVGGLNPVLVELFHFFTDKKVMQHLLEEIWFYGISAFEFRQSVPKEVLCDSKQPTP